MGPRRGGDTLDNICTGPIGTGVSPSSVINARSIQYCHVGGHIVDVWSIGMLQQPLHLDRIGRLIGHGITGIKNNVDLTQNRNDSGGRTRIITGGTRGSTRTVTGIIGRPDGGIQFGFFVNGQGIRIRGCRRSIHNDAIIPILYDIHHGSTTTTSSTTRIIDPIVQSRRR